MPVVPKSIAESTALWYHAFMLRHAMVRAGSFTVTASAKQWQLMVKRWTLSVPMCRCPNTYWNFGWRQGSHRRSVPTMKLDCYINLCIGVLPEASCQHPLTSMATSQRMVMEAIGSCWWMTFRVAPLRMADLFTFIKATGTLGPGKDSGSFV